MLVVMKRPGKPARIGQIANTLEEMQRIVGGYIQMIPLDNDYMMICNEEGKLMNMQPNIWWLNDKIVGPIIIARQNGEDLEDLKRLEANNIKMIIDGLEA
ncbi:DUF3846 domain-containing protein [uncultured Megasphaera sp.]|uniref:DUF3846 domain-containing protein n=1 Tax=uncultured Megasphaera sp. TaxID=165188 RepID=UPI00205620FA|nr:DUF3846 domain-containing protein [uncultured Megasphaera sp.]DAZ68640.1 MAG TPA: protein of unknown function (DUF3846) [Caudoviricetes sp.]